MAQHPQIDLNSALLAHQEGRLAEAEALYRKFGDEMPENADVWHLLGALCHQKGEIKEAERFLDRALELNPLFPEALNTRAILHKENGNLIAAERDLTVALVEIPGFPQALTNLADVMRLAGKLQPAHEFAARALKLAPDLASAYNNLGAIERDLGDLDASVTAFQKALELDPSLIDAAINLAMTLNFQGRIEEALDIAEKTAKNMPNYAPAQNCLGSIYFDSGHIEKAQKCFEQALGLAPHFSDAHNNLANTLTRLNALEAAQVHFDLALKLEPENPDFWANKAAALQAANDIDGAIAACQTALEINPKHADARWNRGIARLISGDLAGGFADYEARWDLPEFHRRDFGVPAWNGENLTRKSILLHSEQGFGDTLQFIRYVSEVSAKQPKAIFLETHAPLRRLLATRTEISEVFSRGEALPKIDVHCPIMALPAIFGTTLETIPQRTPYLTPLDPLPADLKIKLAGDSTGDSPGAVKTKIGLVWTGRPSHKNDRNRSIKFKTLRPLLEVPNTQIYSLQLGDTQKDLSTSSGLIDLRPHLLDFAATAVVLNQLDLVITVDTAVAHLAGALGKKCWVLLPFAPDWRWLQKRNDSPWYPSLTLFRQTTPGDWAGVVALVIQKLSHGDFSG